MGYRSRFPNLSESVELRNPQFMGGEQLEPLKSNTSSILRDEEGWATLSYCYFNPPMAKSAIWRKYLPSTIFSNAIQMLVAHATV